MTRGMKCVMRRAASARATFTHCIRRATLRLLLLSEGPHKIMQIPIDVAFPRRVATSIFFPSCTSRPIGLVVNVEQIVLSQLTQARTSAPRHRKRAIALECRKASAVYLIAVRRLSLGLLAARLESKRAVLDGPGAGSDCSVYCHFCFVSCACCASSAIIFLLFLLAPRASIHHVLHQCNFARR